MRTFRDTVKTQSKQFNLATLNVAPKLVNGNVIIFNEDGTYSKVKPFNNVTIADDFEPAEYALCYAEYEVYDRSYGLQWNPVRGNHTQQLIKNELVNKYDCYRIGKVYTREAEYYKTLKLANEMKIESIVAKHCNRCCDNLVDRLKPGDKIHLHSKNGIYEVVSVDYYFISITCKKWLYTDKPVQHIKKSDFKCLAGGLHNWSR